MTKKRFKAIKTRKQKFGVPRSVKKNYPDVKYVVDANEAVNVSVCKADVKDAASLDPTNCALARAVKREHHADAAIIGLSSSYIINGDKAIRFATPQLVQREIISFDRHHDFEPGDYYLTPKAPSSRLGMSTGKQSKGGENKDLHGVTFKKSKTQKIRILPSGQA